MPERVVFTHFDEIFEIVDVDHGATCLATVTVLSWHPETHEVGGTEGAVSGAVSNGD